MFTAQLWDTCLPLKSLTELVKFEEIISFSIVIETYYVPYLWRFEEKVTYSI